MGLIVDNFAGGGGASTGIEAALGRSVDIAINHDRKALAMHAANHPRTRHIVENVWKVRPREVTQGQPVDVAWFSPDCTHFSKAKGGAPKRDPNRAKRSRGLAWVVIRWAAQVRPRVIFLENVEEFEAWGPLSGDGTPCPRRRGETFRRFVRQLERLGYAVDWRQLRACDYGAPTIRKRLFLVARRDGHKVVWPAPTHGPLTQGSLTGRPYRTAAEIIDWSVPCPSIFERKRPLAEATLRRIARGIKRYVIDAAQPFIVPMTRSYAAPGSGADGDDRCHDLDEPLRTITTANRGELAVVAPFLAGCGGRAAQSPERDIAAPLGTITAKADQVLIAPTLIQTGYGERNGQHPRAPGLDKPLGTVVAGGAKHALVAAFLAQHNTGMTGHDARAPLSTLTERATQQQVVTAHLMQMKGSDRRDRPATEPTWTVTAGGQHIAEVRAFLVKYFGTATAQDLRDPLHTATAKARFGLVTVQGEVFQIADIGMRMLTPRELYRAQGFPDSYRIETGADGAALTKTDQIRMCGNSVAPPVAEALVRANAAFAMTAARQEAGRAAG